MKHMPGIGLGLLLLLVGAAPQRGAAQAVESWTAHYPLAAGGRVAVTNVQGSLWVEGWDRDEVELTVWKSAESAEAPLAGVQIEVESQPGSFEAHTLYRGQSEQPVRVDYRLRVPRQVSWLGLRTVNGDIRVRNVEGWVETRTLNGDIEQGGGSGSVVARTVNGDVSVAVRLLPDAGGRLELETINGDVNLLLPPQANADLELSTVAGRIESPLAVPTRAVAGEAPLRARLGRGGVRVRLRTVRGIIRVDENEDSF